MASNKNQHFVPRCYLRSFTGNAGRTINVFNLDLQRTITGAPVRNQCSGDYFYGEDLVTEKALQQFEGAYAATLSKILAPGYQLVDADAHQLKDFWLLQYMRTEAASRRTVEMFEGMDAEIGGLPPGYKPSIKEAVQTAMTVFSQVRQVVVDLKVRLVRNLSGRSFITSDNPAVMSNRWHLSDPRAAYVPGLRNAGLLGLLPLSPAVMCVLYDGDVYSLPHSSGWLALADDVDADAFNEHQLLNCDANLYFATAQEGDEVVEMAARLAQNRPKARHRIEQLVLDTVEADGSKIYRVASREEANAQQNSIVHTSGVLASPSRWPPQLKWRAGGFVYDSSTGAGFARRHTRERGSEYRKVRLRP